MEEERKVEVTGSITKATGSRKEAEGRKRVENERMRREVKIGRITKERHDKRGNNIDIV